ncbi:GGDEF domain-containing protein [Mixta theicola]|uniref:diguanylate cyclase n=1 Tax=Mixta theicola TaxID=1458355 RepID=A0A2K1QE78_9GAMM|nr:GGDEF domain-containing protein [Mixta theicola]PNS13332.1 GGDEF domain-containing protein [Mixta theicola]GLR09631.1 response regulator [Mixta theicola]
MKISEKLSGMFVLHSSLGRTMTIFMLLLLTAVLMVSAWTLNRSWAHKLQDIRSNAVNLSVSQARQAEDTFLQTEITLRAIQRDIPNNGPTYANKAALSAVLAEMKRGLPQLNGLFVYDAQGNWVATAAQTPTGMNNADREYFLYHRKNRHGGSHIGHVIRSRSTGELVIPVSIRLNDSGGGFVGVALATVRIDSFRRFYSYFEMGDGDLLALLLDDGTALYVRPFPDSFINRSLSSSPLFTTQLVRADRGTGTWNSALDNKVRIFGYARSGQYPLIVAAGFDKSALWSQWLHDSMPDLVLNGMLLIVIVMIGTVVLRQVRTNVENQIELTTLRDELTTINQSLQALALLDGLTGLANRRQFDIFLAQNLKRSAISGRPVGLIMMDVDFFKRYNDTYGHVAGDNCLRRVGEALKNLPLRQTDLIARYGGEEFAIVLPDATPDAALRIAQSAVEAVREAAIPHKSTALKDEVVTLSAGCFVLVGSDTGQDAQLIKEGADHALYQAKHNGRNRAVVNEAG